MSVKACGGLRFMKRKWPQAAARWHLPQQVPDAELGEGHLPGPVSLRAHLDSAWSRFTTEVSVFWQEDGVCGRTADLLLLDLRGLGRHRPVDPTRPWISR
jgi:hypothetical protein